MCEFEEHELESALDRHVKMHEGGTLPFADAILCDLGLLKGCGYEPQR